MINFSITMEMMLVIKWKRYKKKIHLMKAKKQKKKMKRRMPKMKLIIKTKMNKKMKKLLKNLKLKNQP